jgi:hypothetical protein
MLQPGSWDTDFRFGNGLVCPSQRRARAKDSYAAIDSYILNRKKRHLDMGQQRDSASSSNSLLTAPIFKGVWTHSTFVTHVSLPMDRAQSKAESKHDSIIIAHCDSPHKLNRSEDGPNAPTRRVPRVCGKVGKAHKPCEGSGQTFARPTRSKIHNGFIDGITQPCYTYRRYLQETPTMSPTWTTETPSLASLSSRPCCVRCKRHQRKRLAKLCLRPTNMSFWASKASEACPEHSRRESR